MTNAANNEYVPLVQEGATWNYASFVHKKPYPYTVYIQGDTSLLGVTYKKCYIKFYENYADSCLTENEKSYLSSKNPQLIAFLREEDKKVYCLYKHANYPKLFNNYEWGKCVRQEINDKAIDMLMESGLSMISMTWKAFSTLPAPLSNIPILT